MAGSESTKRTNPIQGGRIDRGIGGSLVPPGDFGAGIPCQWRPNLPGCSLVLNVAPLITPLPVISMPAVDILAITVAIGDTRLMGKGCDCYHPCYHERP
jgi:hypothetical protein